MEWFEDSSFRSLTGLNGAIGMLLYAYNSLYIEDRSDLRVLRLIQLGLSLPYIRA